ncbi:MAG TPA: biotin/lipoyl-binding protein, partial [Rhodopila sp.]|nr:biotin/lipoyl-binding protein [Rhodopila sp.]
MTGHLDTLVLERQSAPASAGRRTRVWIGSAALVLLLAGGAAVFAPKWLSDTSSAAAQPAAPTPPPVTVSPPVQRDLANWTTFTGQFSAVDHVDLRAQVSGYLTEIHFVDGQIVHQGDLLF